MVGTTKTRVAWCWCCQQPQFTSRQMQDAAEMNKGYGNNVIAKWLKLGVIERLPEMGSPAHYRVVNAEQAPALGQGSNSSGRIHKRRRSRRKTQQQKMWNTMMINRSFGLVDLMLTCNAQLPTAFVYAERLVRAGYLRVIQRYQPAHSAHEREPVRYQLVRNTGRRAPIIRPSGCWDQNEQQFYPFLIEENAHGNVA